MQRPRRETVEMLKDLSPGDLNQKRHSAQGAPITAWKLLRALVEHEVHHRGEMYVYLALLGALASSSVRAHRTSIARQ